MASARRWPDSDAIADEPAVRTGEDDLDARRIDATTDPLPKSRAEPVR